MKTPEVQIRGKLTTASATSLGADAGPGHERHEGDRDGAHDRDVHGDGVHGVCGGRSHHDHGQGLMATDERLSIKQTAERLGISPETIRGWLRDGQLPFAYYKLGKRVVFRAIDVDAWFEAQRVPSARELDRAMTPDRRP